MPWYVGGAFAKGGGKNIFPHVLDSGKFCYHKSMKKFDR
jgi:hypothetical protein